MYPEVLPIIRDHINLRYHLIPYMYSLVVEAAETGHPITRPLGLTKKTTSCLHNPSKNSFLVYHFSEDPKVAENSFDFMLGPYMLIASIYKEGKVYILRK